MKKLELRERYPLFIDGGWKDPSDDTWFDMVSPITGESLAQGAEASREDVQLAVDAAWAAFDDWASVSPAERAVILNQIADVMDENTEMLALAETLDNGKPLRETMVADIPESSRHFRYFAGAVQADEGSATMLDDDTLSIVLREPIGVAGQIVPWNFPMLMAAWKLAPALASGCCVVLKPSSHTSLSVLLLAELLKDVLPAGVLNVVTGSGSRSGQYVLENKDLSKLAFTGSTEVGRSVGLAAAEKIIPSTLELGGKSANIFFDDVDMDIAMDNLTMGILFNQGQVCSAGSRVFVQESIYDHFVERAVDCFNHVRVGDPRDINTQMGTLIYQKHLEDVLEYVEIGKNEGATVACGGAKVTVPGVEKGLFMAPTLLTHVTNDMRVAQEEIFGPVAVVIPFKEEEDVIAMANDTVYGLAGGVHTKDIHRALRVARAVRTGRMWVNCYNRIPAGAPFGGYKESGIGRETHKELLDHYSEKKNIMINISGAPLGMFDV